MFISISLQPPPPLERNALLKQGKEKKELAALRLVLLSALKFRLFGSCFYGRVSSQSFMTAHCRLSRSVAICYSIIASRKDKGI